MKKVYKSKIGLELVIPLVLFFGTVLFLSWVSAIVLLPVIAFVVHLFLTTNYTIEGENLTIKSGFVFNKTIDINTIKKISETNNFLSSPATSLERLEITYRKYDSVLISPKLKKEFITEITALNQHIDVAFKKI